MNGFVVLPYILGVSEGISHLLKQQQAQVSYKPQKLINSLSPRPKKKKKKTDHPSSGVVYKIKTVQFHILWPDREVIENAGPMAQNAQCHL